MADVVVTEFMDEAALVSLRRRCDVLFDPTLVTERDRLLRALQGCEGLIVRNRTQVDAAVLEAAPRLKIVGRLGVGLDNIDLAACAARGVVVAPATGANTVSVAEYVLATALTLLRGAYQDRAAVLDGAWPRDRLIGGEASGKQIGLLGFGVIAQAVARRAHAFGMIVAAHDPFLAANDPAWPLATRRPFDDLLAQSDVLSLHVPLNPETRGLIGSEALERMKPGAILINTARGEIVDPAALVEALRSGAIGGAALDVFAEEPLGREAAQVFAETPNLILTPHIAGLTLEANARVSAVTAQAVERALFGEA